MNLTNISRYIKLYKNKILLYSINMSCYITCLVGASLLGGSISSMLFKNDPRSKVLASRLNPQQMVVYNNIVVLCYFPTPIYPRILSSMGNCMDRFANKYYYSQGAFL